MTERPPLTAVQLDDWRLWQHVERGQLADLTPLISRQVGRVFWVPGTDGQPGQRSGGRIVVTERLHGDDCWLPAGVYADQWTLREESTLSASQLLALPGVTDLSRRYERQRLLGV